MPFAPSSPSPLCSASVCQTAADTAQIDSILLALPRFAYYNHPLPSPCSTFTVTYRYPLGGRVTGASLAAPCADTHSINMNQRVVFLEVGSLAVHVFTSNTEHASDIVSG